MAAGSPRLVSVILGQLLLFRPWLLCPSKSVVGLCDLLRGWAGSRAWGDDALATFPVPNTVHDPFSS